ncbi:hypothetical protein FT637_24875 [Bacillus cereus]|uniref:hypothetical protein n=1 Tax=Bacillus cereus TaxID=1396 RepID=UPI001D0D649B|nr:hypothetical protein [Bacillus cereus]MBE7106122.1 hypothetical protein [Bacillus cereus]
MMKLKDENKNEIYRQFTLKYKSEYKRIFDYMVHERETSLEMELNGEQVSVFSISKLIELDQNGGNYLLREIIEIAEKYVPLVANSLKDTLCNSFSDYKDELLETNISTIFNYKGTKYRLGHDYNFHVKKAFTYKNELIGGMSLDVLFKVYDKNGDEVLFESDQLNEQIICLENGETCYLTNFVQCYFDRNNIFRFKPNVSLLEKSGYIVQWEIYGYTKGLGDVFIDGQCISTEEFMDIMKNNIDQFDISDNYPVESNCSYFTQEVKE